ncbi:MAG: hypothetical protein ABR552_03380, partial [Actinomycetota bacterium]
SRPGNADLSFDPVPALELFEFPARAGLTWSARGVDPLAHTVMSFDAQIARTDIIDACGTRVEAWLVDVTNGSVQDTVSGTDIKFNATIDIAPQFGGIAVFDKIDWEGTDRGTDVLLVNTARIMTEPRFPS